MPSFLLYLATFLIGLRVGHAKGSNKASRSLVTVGYADWREAMDYAIEGDEIVGAAGGVRRLVQRQPTKSRELVMGIASAAAIAAGASADVQGQPQIAFRPDRIVVPSAVAASFIITDLKIGKNSQLVSGGAVHAQTFAEGAFGVRLKLDTLAISQTVLFRVTNISAAAATFYAALIGPSVE